MTEVWDHSLREKLLLLLLSQRELCLQLGVCHLWLSSITSKTAEELLLSLRTSAPHVQTARMPENVVSNQSLEMVLLLPGGETDLRSTAAADSQPVPALEVRVTGLLLCETVRMCVKHVLVVLQLLDPISKELARIVRRAPTEVRQARRQSLRLRDRLEGILTGGGRWVPSEWNLLQGSGTHEILLLLSLGVNLLGVVAKQFTVAVLRWRPVDAELQLFVQMLR